MRIIFPPILSVTFEVPRIVLFVGVCVIVCLYVQTCFLPVASLHLSVPTVILQ